LGEREKEVTKGEIEKEYKREERAKGEIKKDKGVNK
jgi:hypothetical protein